MTQGYSALNDYNANLIELLYSFEMQKKLKIISGTFFVIHL